MKNKIIFFLFIALILMIVFDLFANGRSSLSALAPYASVAAETAPPAMSLPTDTPGVWATPTPVSISLQKPYPTPTVQPAFNMPDSTAEAGYQLVSGGPNPNERVFVLHSVVPHTAVPLNYFDDALFIGDSALLGFFDYGYLPNASFIAQLGIGVFSLDRMAFETSTGDCLRFDVALAKMAACQKLYIDLGSNDIGYGKTAEEFIQSYRLMLARVRAVFPTQPIYVHAIFPITKIISESTEDSKIDYRQSNIDDINVLLLELCEQMQAEGDAVYYLAVNEIFRDNSGYLHTDIAKTDGYHIKQPYNQWWVQYLRTHTVR